MSRSTDALVAELLEQLGRMRDYREASQVALASALEHTAFERGGIVVRREEDRWEIGRGLASGNPEFSALPVSGTALERSLRGGEPTLLRDSRSAAEAGFRPCAVLPFQNAAGEPLGGLLLETDELDRDTAFLASVFRRCAPTLDGLVARETLRERNARVEQESTLLGGIHDTLPDPVILTDPGNDIVVANRRADELFSARAGDSPGRTRAVHTNTFLFSAFLTQEQIGEGEEAARELNLVDPSDGSDLLFEVLTTTLSPERTNRGFVISVLRDITDLKRAVNELELEYRRSRGAEHRARQESQRLNAIIENAAEPILVTDARSKIVLMNPEAERLFDVPADRSPQEEGRRQVWTNVTRFTSLVNEFLLQPETRRTEMLILTEPETGRQFPVQAVKTKILDRVDEPVAIVTILRDLTQELENERLARELRELNEGLEERIEIATGELAERNRILEWQSDELEKASRLKSEFLARMSHELRTPINAMLGYTSLLQERVYGELDGEQEQALEKIQTASNHLLTLISEILDLSKIEAGKMPLRVEEVRLEEQLSAIMETIGPMLDEKRLEFRREIEEDLPPFRTDPTKLRQVLLNLVQNGIKYTEEGSVTVRAGLADGGSHVHIEIEDTGIGIREEDLDLIFEDFRQADQSPARAYGGTGLGLSISRKLLAMMGGAISVESTYGEGSRFRVELPLRTEEDAVENQVRRATLESADAGSGMSPTSGSRDSGPPPASTTRDSDPSPSSRG